MKFSMNLQLKTIEGQESSRDNSHPLRNRWQLSTKPKCTTLTSSTRYRQAWSPKPQSCKQVVLQTTPRNRRSTAKWNRLTWKVVPSPECPAPSKSGSHLVAASERECNQEPSIIRAQWGKCSMCRVRKVQNTPTRGGVLILSQRQEEPRPSFRPRIEVLQLIKLISLCLARMSCLSQWTWH